MRSETMMSQRARSASIAGARRGTILAIPNAGAAPKGYMRTFAPTLGTSSDVTNAASTLKAFWSDATDIRLEQQNDRRTIVNYRAPTVKRGVLPQRIVADRLACASAEGPDSLVVAERWAQASVVDDADAALTSLSGAYTAWHRYDRVDQGVRETLRVAAFDDSPAADDIRRIPSQCCVSRRSGGRHRLTVCVYRSPCACIAHCACVSCVYVCVCVACVCGGGLGTSTSCVAASNPGSSGILRAARNAVSTVRCFFSSGLSQSRSVCSDTLWTSNSSWALSSGGVGRAACAFQG